MADINPWIWHLIAYPIYQILGTLRHEGSHAIEVMWHGGVVWQFQILPHFYRGSFYWGRVRWVNPLSAEKAIRVLKAPYYVNAACIAWGVVLGRAVLLEVVALDHIARFGLIMLLLSPAIDTLYNLAKLILRRDGDFARIGEYR